MQRFFGWWVVGALISCNLNSQLYAGPIPSREAAAEAFARFNGVAVGPFSKVLPGNPFADEMALSFPVGGTLDNSSLGTAASFTDLSLHSRSRVTTNENFINVVGNPADEARSLARNISHWVASGPGTDFTLDLELAISGVLDVGAAALAGFDFGEWLASVEISMLLHTAYASVLTPLTVFDAAADLTGDIVVSGIAPADFQTTLTTSGDWSNSDFTSGATSFVDPDGFLTLGESFTLSGFQAILPGVATIPIGETFAIEFEIRTGASAFGAVEEGYLALADFFDSASFTVSTTTPGVTLNQVTGPVSGPGAAVPEPATLISLMIGLTVLGLGRSWRQRGRRRRTASQFP